MLMEIINDYNYNGQIIELQIGDVVKIGEKTDPNSDYPNWIYCISEKNGKAGWVADHIMTINDDIAVVNENYISEEMTVTAGDIVDTIFDLNGWCWCRRIADSKEAWVDKKNLKPTAL
jgi:hypothetical protein